MIADISEARALIRLQARILDSQALTIERLRAERDEMALKVIAVKQERFDATAEAIRICRERDAALAAARAHA